MSFEVGTYIDISHVNKKREAAPLRHKKSLPETARHLHAIGTSFVFQTSPEGLRAAVRIPVALA
jgi:hypothetical protein